MPDDKDSIDGKVNQIEVLTPESRALVEQSDKLKLQEQIRQLISLLSAQIASANNQNNKFNQRNNQTRR
jgi:hypothetical protein